MDTHNLEGIGRGQTFLASQGEGEVPDSEGVGGAVRRIAAVHGLAHHLLRSPHHLHLPTPNLSLSILHSATATAPAGEDDGGGLVEVAPAAEFGPFVNLGPIVGFIVLDFFVGLSKIWAHF